MPRPSLEPSVAAPVDPSKLACLLIFFCAALLAACQVTPTPTVVPIPTATYIPTETPVETPPATPTVVPIHGVVTDTLRVRELPSTSAKILARLRKDDSVFLLARSEDNLWYGIEYPPDSGEHAWISSAIVIPDSPTDQLPVGFTLPPPPPGSIFANVLHPLNVRQGPSRDYDIIASLPPGARITLIARSEDGMWYETYYPPDSTRTAWLLGDPSILQLLGATDQMALAAAPPTPTPAPTPIPRPTRTPGPPGPAGTGRVLASSNRGGGYDIYSFAENGAVRQRLTSMGDAYGGRFSPDANRVVLSHIVATVPVVTSHIYVMNADGSALRDVSARAGGASDSEPDWSPDGSRLAFVRTTRAAGPEIWIMSVDGSGARRVVALSIGTGISNASAGDFSIQPRWSPDGGRLAFAAVPSTPSLGAPLYPNIFVVSADGTNLSQLTDNDQINSSPVWSPDGKQIMWSAKDFINRQNWKVWAMNASGGNQHIVISQLLGDGNNGVQGVEWIGNRVLLSGWTGNWNAYLANADGSKITAVTSEASDDIPTDWAP